MISLLHCVGTCRVIGWKGSLRKPNRGEGIDSAKPNQKVVYDLLGLMCVHLHNIFHTPMARYSLFVLKVPLNTVKPKHHSPAGQCRTTTADHRHWLIQLATTLGLSTRRPERLGKSF